MHRFKNYNFDAKNIIQLILLQYITFDGYLMVGKSQQGKIRPCMVRVEPHSVSKVMDVKGWFGNK